MLFVNYGVCWSHRLLRLLAPGFAFIRCGVCVQWRRALPVFVSAWDFLFHAAKVQQKTETAKIFWKKSTQKSTLRNGAETERVAGRGRTPLHRYTATFAKINYRLQKQVKSALYYNIYNIKF